ncbi:TetR/AcrR family transcriptional regulator [Streptomyces sp. NPDC059597]|uniref:TetR/AcrR family transcriptional regulator n=1 Tax=Streptomyces sp. NPDC059597 TaxID=3346879 RepID=UPI0036843D02
MSTTRTTGTTGTTAHRQRFPASPSASLTERRKAETRMEIARAAATLFVRQGLKATRAEDIAAAAGIAPRTFYRYFASKEEAVAPLYAAGAECWTQAVRAAPAHLTIPGALRHAVEHTLAPGSGVSASTWEWARTLVRMAHTGPALRKVWAEVCQEAEEELARALAERRTGAAAPTRSAEESDNVAGPGADTGSSTATGSAAGAGSSAGAGAATGVGLAADAGPVEGAGPVSGTGSSAGAGSPAAVEGQPAPVTPRLRFAAAVAGAAVRVAVESWAHTTAPHTGATGPAALALRNLDALTGFDWEEEPGRG